MKDILESVVIVVVTVLLIITMLSVQTTRHVISQLIIMQAAIVKLDDRTKLIEDTENNLSIKYGEK